LVVPVFSFLFKKSGYEHLRSIQHAVMWAYFLHLVVNSFLVVVVTSSVFQMLLMGIDSGSEFWDMLSQAIPNASSFFIIFIAGIMLMPFTSLFPFGGILGWLKGLFKPYDYQWEEDEAYDPGFFGYGSAIANDVYIFLLASCFALINPAILLAAGIYFLCRFLCCNYLLREVFRTEFQTGGTLVVHGVVQALLCVSLGQLVLFAILLTKKGWVQAGLVSPLFVVSLILCLFVSYARGKNVLDKGLSEEWATELSRASNGSLQEITRDGPLHYTQPSRHHNWENPTGGISFWQDNGQPWEEVEYYAGEAKHGSQRQLLLR